MKAHPHTGMDFGIRPKDAIVFSVLCAQVAEILKTVSKSKADRVAVRKPKMLARAVLTMTDVLESRRGAESVGAGTPGFAARAVAKSMLKS